MSAAEAFAAYLEREGRPEIAVDVRAAASGTDGREARA